MAEQGRNVNKAIARPKPKKPSNVNVNRAIANAGGRVNRAKEAERVAKKEKDKQLINIVLSVLFIAFINLIFGVLMLFTALKINKVETDYEKEALNKRFNILLAVGAVIGIVTIVAVRMLF